MLRRYLYYLPLCFVLLTGCASLKNAFSLGSVEERIVASKRSWLGAQSAAVKLPPPIEISGPVNPQFILNKLLYVSPLRSAQIPVGRVADDNSLNAFTEGRAIYVTAGMTQALGSDEGMMAGILGHELGHIIAGHVQSQVTRNMVTALMGAVVSNIGNEDAGAKEVVARSLLTEAVTLGQAAYSRREEKEADAIGTFLAFRAGYDSTRLIDFFDLLESQQKKTVAPYLSQLVPLIGQYSKAYSAMKSSSEQLKLQDSVEGRQQYIKWAKQTTAYKSQILQVVASFRKNAAATGAIYSSHPLSDDRKRTISLVTHVLKRQLALEELENLDRELAEVFKVIAQQSPLQ